MAPLRFGGRPKIYYSVYRKKSAAAEPVAEFLLLLLHPSLERHWNGYRRQPVTTAAVFVSLLFLGPGTDSYLLKHIPVSCPPCMTSSYVFQLWFPVMTSGMTSGLTSGMTSGLTSGYDFRFDFQSWLLVFLAMTPGSTSGYDFRFDFRLWLLAQLQAIARA